MKNIRRLSFEIKILEGIFGYRNISYHSGGSWIKISNYTLPQIRCVYNFRFTTILIIIPDEYDAVGVSVSYIDKDLRIRRGLKFEKLPHTHDGKYDREGYQWLCFEMPNRFIGLLDFINTLKVYFTDPFQYQRL